MLVLPLFSFLYGIYGRKIFLLLLLFSDTPCILSSFFLYSYMQAFHIILMPISFSGYVFGQYTTLFHFLDISFSVQFSSVYIIFTC